MEDFNEQNKKVKIALELDNNNVVIGSVYLADQDYTNLIANDNRFTLAEVDRLEDVVEYKTKYENGQLVQLNDYVQAYYDKQQAEEQKQLLKQSIQEIEDWFNDYDMQVKQFNRDVRLGITGTYHIGNTTYTIAELDAAAVTKAAQINTLKAQLNSLGE